MKRKRSKTEICEEHKTGDLTSNPKTKKDKKKKKGKERDTNYERENDSEPETKKKKIGKAIMRDSFNDKDGFTSNKAVDHSSSKKSRKKKAKELIINKQCIVNENVDKVKEKKRKKESFESDACVDLKQSSTLKKNKKRNKNMKECCAFENDGEHLSKKKKKKKKNRDINETESVGESKKKKKKNRDTNKTESVGEGDKQSKKGAKKNKHQDKYENEIEVNIKTNMSSKSSNKSVKRDIESEHEVQEELANPDIVHTEIKKKKKNEEYIENKDVKELNDSIVKKKKKKKKCKEQEQEACADIDPNREIKKSKKVKLEKQEKNYVDAPQDIAKNTIGVTQQMPAVTVGQWGTASLGNDDRQNKFLRLMGGFKKDPQNNASSPLFGAKKFNSALDTKGVTSLNEKLESEFNRALAFKMGQNHGIGLGFTPPPGEGKKFHIDTGASKSMKFSG